jgi:dienelactone hydrolase
MKRALTLLLPLLLAAPLASPAQAPAAAPAQAPPAAPPAARAPETVATELIDRLARGELQAAVSNFTTVMQAAVPPEKLAQIWAQIQAQMGAYQRRVAVRAEKQGAYDVVFVTAELAHGRIDFKVAVDAAGRIAGFFIVPVSSGAGEAAPPAYSAPDYADPKSFHERDVVIDAAGDGKWALPGTLAMPVTPAAAATAALVPAVVLVHGSGPNDRDETVGAEKPFRDLAWGLASRGIAVLRYEKRTRQHGAEIAGLQGFTVQQETVDDAVAAAELLRHTAGIDPQRVFVLGHSLGGMLVPRIGRRDPRLAGLIVMAGAARPLEDIILEQVGYLATHGADSDAAKNQIEAMRQEVAKVKALKPGDTGTLLSAPASYWLDLRGYDPPTVASTLRQPLLILQGERDYQVTMDNFAAWQRALAGRPGVTFKTYPKLNHLFIAGEGDSLPQEYEKPGHVSAAVVADIAAWIQRPKP